MEKRINATIVSIGTELTEGVIQDTHLRYLSQQLRVHGVVVEKAIYLPDNFDLVKREGERALKESDIVIFTGGLGPTSDDITREVISDITGKSLIFSSAVWDSIVNRFKGRRIADVNKKQALVPVGFEWLKNDLGTAPGLYGKYERKVVIALPGPPGELRWVFENEALPRIIKDFNLGGEEDDILKCSVFMTPESELEEALLSCREVISVEDIRWGTRVTEYFIEFSIRCKNKDVRESVFKCLRDKLGYVRVRRGVVSPPLVLFNLLKDKGFKLVTVESCTGGLVGKLITDIPGSSAVFWGGMIVYSNDAKEKLAGIPGEILKGYGAVSKETVEFLAKGALESSNADLAIAISGIAGPDGGTQNKPVGTVFIGIGLKDKERIELVVKDCRFFGSRDSIRRKSAVTAMLLAENLVLGSEWLDRYGRW